MKMEIFWQKWLTVIGIIYAAFGLSITLLINTSAYSWLHESLNLLFFKNLSSPEIIKNIENFKSWIFTIMGALMILIGILLVFISENAIKRKEKWALWAILISTLSWFIFDEFVSIQYKVYTNAISNFIILLLIITPVLFLFKYNFKKKIN